jgi:hypothetical protein
MRRLGCSREKVDVETPAVQIDMNEIRKWLFRSRDGAIAKVNPHLDPVDDHEQRCISSQIECTFRG